MAETHANAANSVSTKILMAKRTIGLLSLGNNNILA
jgi:hypothetical protein